MFHRRYKLELKDGLTMLGAGVYSVQHAVAVTSW